MNESQNSLRKQNNFKRIATRRVNEVADKIESISKLSNKINYEYSDEEVDMIFMFIRERLDVAYDKFKNNKGSRFTL